MTGRQKYPPLFSWRDAEHVRRSIDDLLSQSLVGGVTEEKEERMLRLIESKGARQAAAMLASSSSRLADEVILALEQPVLHQMRCVLEAEFTPDSRFHPELREKLQGLRDTGHPVDSLQASRIGSSTFRSLGSSPRIRFDLPLDANLRRHLPAMETYQEFLQSLEPREDSVVRYVVDEYESRRANADIAADLLAYLKTQQSRRQSAAALADAVYERLMRSVSESGRRPGSMQMALGVTWEIGNTIKRDPGISAHELAEALMAYIEPRYARSATEIAAGLAEELNAAIKAWFNRQPTPLDDLNLKAFVRQRKGKLEGFRPECNYYNAERVQRLIRNHHEGR